VRTSLEQLDQALDHAEEELRALGPEAVSELLRAPDCVPCPGAATAELVDDLGGLAGPSEPKRPLEEAAEEIVGHLGKGCWPCRIRLLALRGVSAAIGLLEDVEDMSDPEPAPWAPGELEPDADLLVTDPPDLCWRLGWPGPLEEVAARAGVGADTLHGQLGRAREEVRPSFAARLKLRAADLPGIDAWWAARRERPSAAGAERRLLAAADDDASGRSITLESRPGPDGRRCIVHVQEFQRGGGWSTRFKCRVVGELPRSAGWRLHFEPERLQRLLYAHQRRDRGLLGTLRLAGGEAAWEELLDHLVPHRRGTFDPPRTLQRVVEGRLPGWPAAYHVHAAFGPEAE